jgi:hypothetical protein
MRDRSVTRRITAAVGSREVSDTLESVAIATLIGVDLIMGTLALLGAPVSGWQVGVWLVISGLCLIWWRVTRRR